MDNGDDGDVWKFVLCAVAAGLSVPVLVTLLVKALTWAFTLALGG